jgi:hypothetical protein
VLQLDQSAKLLAFLPEYWVCEFRFIQEAITGAWKQHFQYALEFAVEEYLLVDQSAAHRSSIASSDLR